MQRQTITKGISAGKGRKNVISAGIVFPIAMIISLVGFSGKPSPFAASLCGAFSGVQCISAFVGNAVGAFFGGSYVYLVSAVSSTLAIMTIRLFLSRFDNKLSEFFSIITVTFSVFASEFPYIHGASDFIMTIIVSAVSGGMTYALFRVLPLLKSISGAETIVQNDSTVFVSLIAVLSSAFYILSEITFNIFNLGIIFSALISLISVLRFGAAGGLVAACSCSLGIAAATGEGYYAAVLSLAVAISCAFVNKGKYITCGIFTLAAAICMAVFVMDEKGLSFMADVMAGGAIFMVVPESITDRDNIMSLKRGEENGIRKIFSRRMMFARNAISEVRQTVQMTAEKLDAKKELSDSGIYDTACDAVCRKCRCNMLCWGNEYGDTVKIFSFIVREMKNGKELTPEMFSGKLSERCTHKQELIDKMLSLYKISLARTAERHRVKQLRSILTMQLSATEDLIDKLSEDEFLLDGYDSELSKTARSVLLTNGTESLDAVGVTVGEKGRMSVEAYSKEGFTYGKEKIADAMTLAMHRQFDLPVVTKTDGCFRLAMFSKTTYSLDVEVYQISKEQGKVCGDYFESFVDRNGNAYVILSDGMGSGSRARVDSAFACGMLARLLRAGVGIEAGIAIINLSLMVKSSDESFATLEICKIDLYSGKVEIYKAGSANTYIKCGSSEVKSCCKGLPVGINDKVSCEKQTFNLRNGDMIVMTSDGAQLNDKWIFREMKNSSAKLSEFSKNIAETAKFYSDEEENDDISVIAMRLKKL